MKHFHLIISLILASIYSWGSVSRIVVDSEAYGRAGSPLLLGQFAKFEGFDTETIEQLKSIPIVSLPKTGQGLTLSNQNLSQIIRTAVRKIVPHHVLLHLPATFAIKNRTEGNEFSNAEIIKRLNEKFRQICQQCEFEFSNLRIVAEVRGSKCEGWAVPKIIEIPKGAFVYSLLGDCEVPGIDPVSSGASSLNGTTLAKVYGKVRVLAAVPVVQRSMVAGEIIQVEDIKMESRDMTMSTDGFLDSREYLNRPVKINLVPGQILAKRHLDRIKAIRKNEAIRMMLGEDNWQVTALGIAQENGYVGDMIKIMNPTTQKVVVGELIERGVARIK